MSGLRALSAAVTVAATALLLAGCGSSTAGIAAAASDTRGTQSGGQGVTPVLPRDGGTAQPASSNQSGDQSSDQPQPDTAGPSSQLPVTVAPPSTENQATTAAPRSTPPLVVSTITKTSQPSPDTSTAPQTGSPTTVSLTGFRSPSGNISCRIFTDEQPGYVRCDLTASNISPDAHDCHGTGIWGKSVTLEAGKPAEMRCISDTVTDPSMPTLAYGQTSIVGAFSCTSQQDGMKCKDTDGQGFQLDRNALTTTGGGTTSPAATSKSSHQGTSAALSISTFHTPSGNISCQIATDQRPASVRCDLNSSNIPDSTHDCHGVGDWGHSVTLEAGKPAAMRCISDTVADPSKPVLQYGQSTSVGGITCTSGQDGMVCNDGAGHGFKLSRDAYSVH